MNKDVGVDYFANEYNEEHWKDYNQGFKPIDIPANLLNTLPEDIIRPLIYLLGYDYTSKWITMRFEDLDNQTPLELSKTKKGIKALKAFIMRMPN